MHNMDRKSEHPVTPSENPPESLTLLWDLHNERPVDPGLWNRAVGLAQWEELHNRGLQRYHDVPLNAFLELAEKAKTTSSSIDRYRLLTKPSPNGALWFDILYGLTSPEVINTIGYYINQAHWPIGLDLGTGTGILARKITRHCSRVIAFDQSEQLLKIAKYRHELAKGGKFKISEVAGDIMRLPLSNDYVDLAVSSGLTSWLNAQELDGFVRELKRVLMPGGFYVSAAPTKPPNDALDAKTLLADMIVDVVNGSHQKRHEDIVDFQTYGKIFTQHGFNPYLRVYPQYSAAVTCFRKPG